MADWLAIEERYERRRWGLREIIEAEFDKMASGSPSEIGKLMSAVGVRGVWPLVTGYFDIGALLSLDGHWQRLEGMRVLMGDEVSRSTRRALLD
ncbi:MAG: hypothetical protein WKF96_18905 [Solirubrobacteraceae bacterium]